MKVNECMSHNVMWVNPETPIYDCANIMAEHKIGCVPVCNDKKNVVGLVTDRDILLRAFCCEKDAKATPVSEIMSTNIYCCASNDPITTAEKIMSENQIRRLPVIDNNKIVGILSIGDIGRNSYSNKQNYAITIENICKCGNKNEQ